jgi:hypothetical protein
MPTSRSSAARVASSAAARSCKARPAASKSVSWSAELRPGRQPDDHFADRYWMLFIAVEPGRRCVLAVAGEPASADRIADPVRFAVDLAGFLTALRSIDLANGPRPGKHNWFRGGTLRTYDGAAQKALAELDGHLDVDMARKIWKGALDSCWDGAESWFHGDVAEGNLLLNNGPCDDEHAASARRVLDEIFSEYALGSRSAPRRQRLANQLRRAGPADPALGIGISQATSHLLATALYKLPCNTRVSPDSRAWLVQAGAWLGRVPVLAAYWQDATTASGHNACPAPKTRSARPA